MGWSAIPIETPLRDYEPPELQLQCARCNRTANLKVQVMAKRFGANISIGDLARRIAASGPKPCGLALTGQCSALAWQPPVWHWADLDRAWKGGWMARLRCRRNRAGLKATKPCPEMVIVDVETLVATLGYDFKLENLPSRLQCPQLLVLPAPRQHSEAKSRNRPRSRHEPHSRCETASASGPAQ